MKWNGLERKPIRKVSPKKKKELPEYTKLIAELRAKCFNRSELSGKKPDWQSNYQVEPHHIMGRTGKRLTDPYNIILLNRDEHNAQDGNTYQEKQELLDFIKPIRERQGYEPH